MPARHEYDTSGDTEESSVSGEAVTSTLSCGGLGVVGGLTSACGKGTSAAGWRWASCQRASPEPPSCSPRTHASLRSSPASASQDHVRDAGQPCSPPLVDGRSSFLHVSDV
jgi:hypothetical protein